MTDATVIFDLSEQRNVFAIVTPQTGTVTINSGTVTLYDQSGNVAGGVSGAALGGNDSGPQSAATAWYMLKPGLLGLTAGQQYTLSFLLNVTAGGITSVIEVKIAVIVTADYG